LDMFIKMYLKQSVSYNSMYKMETTYYITFFMIIV